MKKNLALFNLLFAFAINSFAQNNIPSYIPTNGLVGWWPFNGNANDESGNGNNGTVNGATLTTDRFGTNNSYYFNGNAKILVNHSNSLIVGNSQSISLWVKVNSLNNNLNCIIQKGTGGGCSTTGYYIAYDGAGSIFHKTFNYGQNSNACGAIGDYSTYDTFWHNIIFVYSPPNNRMYIDGLSSGNGFNCSSCILTNSTNSLIIGARNEQVGYNWNGSLDDIAIYNRALTQQEITQLYQAQSNNNTNTDTTTSAAKQAPPGIPYQAIVRNASGQIMTNANITAQFTLHKDSAIGAVEYQETHSLTTNAQGLINTTLGKGTATQGTFAGINWANTNKFLQVQINLGNGFVDLGTQQLMSVPYALYAANGPKGDKGETGAQGPQGPAGNGLRNGSFNGEMLYWRDSAWVSVSAGAQGQTLNFCEGAPHWGPCPVYPQKTNIVDIDSNHYSAVNIGTQTWMQQNLNVSKYRNGDIIPQVTDNTEWANLTTGAWCWYNNDSATYGAVYGKLYNWYAVNDPRGLAPQGWRVPDIHDYKKLVKFLDQSYDTTMYEFSNGINLPQGADRLKEAGTEHWINPLGGSGGMFDTKFNALPGGIRYSGFFGIRESTQLLISDIDITNDLSLSYTFESNVIYLMKQYKFEGYSVRCIKN